MARKPSLPEEDLDAPIARSSCGRTVISDGTLAAEALHHEADAAR